MKGEVASEVPWEEEFSAGIVERIILWKRRRHMTTAELAERYSELARRPLKVTALNNILAGKRKSIGVSELILFARALDVSPANLLLPIDANDDVEILPGFQMDSWLAFNWFTGVRPQVTPYYEPASAGRAGVLTSTDSEGEERFVDAVLTQELMSIHDRRELEAEYATDDVLEGFPELVSLIARGDVRGASDRAREEKRVFPPLEAALGNLKSIRDRMRARGMRCVELRSDLAVVDGPAGDSERLAALWADKVLQRG